MRNQLEADLRAAMRARDKTTVAVLRTLELREKLEVVGRYL